MVTRKSHGRPPGNSGIYGGWSDIAYTRGFTEAYLIRDFEAIVAERRSAGPPRWNFRGADTAPSMSDSYNPFVVWIVTSVVLAPPAAQRHASRLCIDRGIPLIHHFRCAIAWPSISPIIRW